VTIEKVALLADDAATEASRSERLLHLHLDHSQIDTVEGIPQASLSSSIRFRDFASVFDSGDRSHEATVFRLGQALFDEIDLRLSPDSPDELVERIQQLRRKLALSKWLENAVAPSVDSDLLKNGENRPAKLFTLLSGNKVSRAVDMALEGNDMRLASLISQAGRTGDFRDEMLRQLDDWHKYNADPLIATEYRRLYALLAGIMDISPGNKGRGSDSSPDILVAKDLDWKRAFGLRMWYGCPFESTVSDVFADFAEALDMPHPPATPLPPYLESDKIGTKKWNIPTRPTDVLYCLIRLFSDPAVSLEQVLTARNCSASPTDLRLPWHLYLLLSRVMQKRDFLDRDEEGYSAQADRLTQGYAAQLEQSGQWTLAAFVLLHLETIDG
jgi:nuclear pore complex protein Nup98-Nup96